MLLEEANGCLYDGADYMMEKNQALSVKHSIGTELRHDAGVSEEDLETLKNMDSVQKVHALVQYRNTNLLLLNKKTNEELQDFMEENRIVSGFPGQYKTISPSKSTSVTCSSFSACSLHALVNPLLENK